MHCVDPFTGSILPGRSTNLSNRPSAPNSRIFKIFKLFVFANKPLSFCWVLEILESGLAIWTLNFGNFQPFNETSSGLQCVGCIVVQWLVYKPLVAMKRNRSSAEWSRRSKQTEHCCSVAIVSHICRAIWCCPLRLKQYIKWRSKSAFLPKSLLVPRS